MNYQKKVICVAGMLCCLNVNIFSQSISLKIKSVSVKRAITELREKTGYSFVYVADELDTQKIVTVEAEDLKGIQKSWMK